MSSLADAVAATVATITAMAALGTSAAGLVDATKAFGGGVSNFGLGYIKAALKPYEDALNNANKNWPALVRASWINGVAKEDQKTAVKSFIRLGLSTTNAGAIAKAANVDATALTTALQNIQAGKSATPDDANILGRLNGMIDLAMDAGFERADQQYRNISKLLAGVVSVALAVWAGYLLEHSSIPGMAGQDLLWPSVLAGLLAVPIAPVAKDLTSSLQAAAKAVQAVKG